MITNLKLKIMKTLSELSVREFQNLLEEFFAIPEKRQKMTLFEITDLARRLNKKFNIPIINETREEKIFIKVVLKVDNFLYDHLPNEFYDLVRSIDGGIDDEEAKRLIIVLSKLVNEKINIPYIPEKVEYVIFRFIIAIIINAARKKFTFDSAADAVEKLIIPDQKDASEEQLAALIVTEEQPVPLAMDPLKPN
jgi:hypothetical protein